MLGNHVSSRAINCAKLTGRAWTPNLHTRIIVGDRTPRHAVELDGKVIRRGAEYPTTVTNLSLDGCGLLGHFAIAEKVEVRIGKLGLFAAQVRWAFNGRAGVKFTNRSDARRSDEGKDISADEHAAAVIEYGIIAALIALALASALAGTGTAVGNSLNSASQPFPDIMQVNTSNQLG